MASKKTKKTTEESVAQNDSDVITNNDAVVNIDDESDEPEAEKKPANKGRGRPKKAANGERQAAKSKVSYAEDSGSEDDAEEGDESPPKKSKRGRGRPPKANKATKVTKVKVAGRGRGRPKKV